MIQINYLRNRQYNIQKREIDIKAKVDYSNNLGVQNVIEDSGWILQQLSSPYKNLADRRLSPQSYKLSKGQLVSHRFKSDNADIKIAHSSIGQDTRFSFLEEQFDSAREYIKFSRHVRIQKSLRLHYRILGMETL